VRPEVRPGVGTDPAARAHHMRAEGADKHGNFGQRYPVTSSPLSGGWHIGEVVAGSHVACRFTFRNISTARTPNCRTIGDGDVGPRRAVAGVHVENLHRGAVSTHLYLDKDAPISRAVEAIGRILGCAVLGGLYHR
jgi:hypothetical protein